MIINKPSNYLYYIINVTAIIIGMIYIFISLKNINVKNKKIITFFILFLLVSIASGKLYTVITSKEKISFIKAGLSGYGGLSGAIIFTIIYEKINKLNGIFIKYTIISLPLIYSL